MSIESPTSTVSSKGQVTVPIEVRRRLGLREGDRVEFAFEEGRTVLRPARQPGNPFEAFLGAIPAFTSRDEVNAWVRELREDGDGEPDPATDAGREGQGAELR